MTNSTSVFIIGGGLNGLTLAALLAHHGVPCVLEPILQAHARRLGADVRFGTEFLSLEQDADGVRARIKNLATGEEEVVTAFYLVAADGVNGDTREKLDIGRSGPGILQHWINLIFDTDLPPTLNGKRFTSCFVTDLNATFTPREGGRWLLALQYSPEQGESPEDFDAVRCRKLVAKGAGRSDVKADLIDGRSWEVAAYIADRFCSSRCFLVGDAAHVMPPTGGFGGNTGIHDAHNLAWKLAMVVRGQADASLLNSYDSERRFVASNTQAQALARLRQWFKDLGGKLPPTPPPVDDYDVVFGQRYRDGALIAEGEADAVFVKFKALSGVPGTRVPHFVIRRDGREMSSLDLFDRDFVLLTGADARWCEAASRATANTDLNLSCYRFDRGRDLEDPDEHWPDALGVADDGAVLIRPDGFVAWRVRDGVANPTQALGEALRRIGLRSAVPGAGS
jgi:2-polyprenyl-6-methoxyphenol hydroxylase-like FAD-dependent oxidoreductase